MVNDADRKIYIQSAFRMDTEQKTASELDSLLLTKDFFKKIIVRICPNPPYVIAAGML